MCGSLRLAQQDNACVTKLKTNLMVLHEAYHGFLTDYTNALKICIYSAGILVRVYYLWMLFLANWFYRSFLFSWKKRHFVTANYARKASSVSSQILTQADHWENECDIIVGILVRVYYLWMIFLANWFYCSFLGSWKKHHFVTINYAKNIICYFHKSNTDSPPIKECIERMVVLSLLESW